MCMGIRFFTQVLLFRLSSQMQMHILVALGAESDQILVGIVSEAAPRVDMVNLQFSQSPTVLAAPPIALQHLCTQSLKGFRIEP